MVTPNLNVPGRENTVADCLSRADYPWVIPHDSEQDIVWEPRESILDYEVIEIKGGADSLFAAISSHNLDREATLLELRELMVEQLHGNSDRYGLGTGAKARKSVELLRDSESFPPMNGVQALADALQIKITVLFKDGPAISFVPPEYSKTIHIQCKGGVHFNALRPISPTPEAKVSVSLKGLGVIPKVRKEHVSPVVAIVNGVGTVPEVVPALDVPVLTLNSPLDEIMLLQQHDSVLMDLRAEVSSRTRGKSGPWQGNLKVFQRMSEKFFIRNNLLVFETSPNNFVPVVPESSLRALAKELHEVLTHAGRDKTIQVMRTRFAHPRFPRIISDIIKECVPCQLHKGHVPKQYPVLRRKVSKPFELFAVDLMDLPRTKKGNKVILVGIDLFSKYAYAIPLKSKKSHVVTKAFESHILATVPRTPEILLSDRGPEFRAAYFEKRLKRYGVRHDYSIPYAPCTNGGVERLNRTLKTKLATACHGKPESWDKVLHEVVAQYNRSPHSETGKAPAEFFVQNNDINIPNNQYWKQPRKFTPFVVGDLIMRKVPFQTPGESSKLNPKYQGPLRITHADPNGVTYRARFLTGKRIEVQVHISQIKKFHGQWESPDAGIAKPRLATPVRNPANSQTPVTDVFQLNFEDFADIPISFSGWAVSTNVMPSMSSVSSLESLSIASEISTQNATPVPGEVLDFSGFNTTLRQAVSAPNLLLVSEALPNNDVPQVDQEEEEVVDLRDISYPLLSTPSSVLPEDFENEVGMWEFDCDIPDWSLSPVDNSPTVSEVVSEYCALARTASTPTNQRQLPLTNASELEPPLVPQRMTRARARRLGVVVPEINYGNISNSDISPNSNIHSEDYSVLRQAVCSNPMSIEVPLPSYWTDLTLTSSDISVSIHTEHNRYHLEHTLTLIPKKGPN